MYMILAAFLLSIAVTPLVEVFISGRDKILLSSTVNNSYRTAREASYSYKDMRNVNAVMDEKMFLGYFADTFATSYGLECINPAANPLRFVSPDDTFNDFTVYVDFYYETVDGDVNIAVVTVTAESEYKFRTGYMRMVSYGDTHPYLLSSKNTFTMSVSN